MKVTKRNGNVVLYDDDKVATSIVWANGRTPEETITIKTAKRIADEVFRRLTSEKDMISTADIRACVVDVLQRMSYPKTAESYLDK